VAFRGLALSRDIAREVIETEAEAVRALAARLDHRFDQAIELLFKTRGRVVVSGMGKSGIVCRKIAATLASTGTPAFFLHPAEAIHGDLGALVEGDTVLVASTSGETVEILRLMEYVKRLGIPVLALAGALDSTLARAADVTLDVSVAREACRMNLAPTASTAATLAMGDALAVALYTRRGFQPEDFARNHPGGRLGSKLVRVADVMHTGTALPRVGPEASLREAVVEMSAKTLGMTAVVAADGAIRGVLTDGDVRRLIQKGADFATTPVGSVASASPVLIARDEPAAKALALMEARHITSLLVADGEGRLEGVVQIHDLWRLQMF